MARSGGAAAALRAALGLLLALAGPGAAAGAGRASSWHAHAPTIPSAQAANSGSGAAWTTVVAADGGPVPLGALEPAVRLPWHEAHDQEAEGAPAVEPGLTLVSVTVTPSTVNYRVGPPPRTVEIQRTPRRALDRPRPPSLRFARGGAWGRHPTVPAVVLQVTPLVAARQKALEVDDIYQPTELTFAGPAGRPLVVSCDEASLRPRAMPLPQLVCRTTADLPPANANGQWTVRHQHGRGVGGRLAKRLSRRGGEARPGWVGRLAADARGGAVRYAGRRGRACARAFALTACDAARLATAALCSAGGRRRAAL